MTIQYKVAKDSNGKVGEPGFPADIIYNAALQANVEATVEVPFGIPAGSIPAFQKNNFLTRMTVMPPGAPVFVCRNGTATLPTLPTLEESDSLLIGVIPISRIYQSGDILSFICPASDFFLCVEFFSINGD